MLEDVAHLSLVNAYYNAEYINKQTSLCLMILRLYFHPIKDDY